MPVKLQVKTKITCPQVTELAMTKLFSRTLTFAGIDSQGPDLIAAKFLAVIRSSATVTVLAQVQEADFAGQ